MNRHDWFTAWFMGFVNGAAFMAVVFAFLKELA